MHPTARIERQLPVCPNIHVSDKKGTDSLQASSASEYDTTDILANPRALAHDVRRRHCKARLETRFQHAHDGASCQLYADSPTRTPIKLMIGRVPTLTGFGPKRKLSTFVIEEERKCLLNDKAGTRHTSEMLASDDVRAQFSVENLSVVCEVATQDTARAIV